MYPFNIKNVSELNFLKIIGYKEINVYEYKYQPDSDEIDIGSKTLIELYKYNEEGLLIEKIMYLQNELNSRCEYIYIENLLKEIIKYDADSKSREKLVYDYI